MYYSPFSIVLKYEVPDGKGVYALPHTLAIPGGWGEPRKTPEGQVITPGTPNGPFPYGYVRKKEEEFKFVAEVAHQKSGCISWWGEPIDEADESKGNLVLSYNGPKLRYFRDPAFSYGSESAHNEVYCRGAFAGVAPAPVLGACFTKVGVYDEEQEKYLPTICLCVAVYEKGVDVFYYKPFLRTTPPGMPDATRALEMSLYQEDKPETVNGWRLLGKVAKQSDEHFPPETPWFFNESGSEASCLRRRTTTFNNGAEEITEDTFELYTVVITPTGDEVTRPPSMSFSNYKNTPAMVYTEELTKVHPDVYTSTDENLQDHLWQEDHVFVIATLKGAQYVLVDYIKDEKVLGSLEYDMAHTQKEYFTIGVDPPGTPSANTGQTEGPLPVPMPPTQGNHAHTLWISVYERIRLNIGPADNPTETYVDLHLYQTGTSNGWAGIPEEPDNPYIYYYIFVTRRLRGLFDIRRHNVVSAQDYLKYALYPTTGSNVAEVQERYVDVLYSPYGSADTGTPTYVYGEAPRTSPLLATPEGKQYRVVHNPLASGVIQFGWGRTAMETWDEDFDNTLTRTTYIGAWPEYNWQGAEYVPGSVTFYAGDTVSFLKDRKWPTVVELLYGPNTECEGNGVFTDKGEIGLSLISQNPVDTNEFLRYADHLPAGNFSSLVGYGHDYYPIGSC